MHSINRQFQTPEDYRFTSEPNPLAMMEHTHRFFPTTRTANYGGQIYQDPRLVEYVADLSAFEAHACNGETDKLYPLTCRLMELKAAMKNQADLCVSTASAIKALRGMGRHGADATEWLFDQILPNALQIREFSGASKLPKLDFETLHEHVDGWLLKKVIAPQELQGKWFRDLTRNNRPGAVSVGLNSRGRVGVTVPLVVRMAYEANSLRGLVTAVAVSQCGVQNPKTPLREMLWTATELMGARSGFVDALGVGEFLGFGDGGDLFRQEDAERSGLRRGTDYVLKRVLTPGQGSSIRMFLADKVAFASAIASPHRSRYCVLIESYSTIADRFRWAP